MSLKDTIQKDAEEAKRALLGAGVEAFEVAEKVAEGITAAVEGPPTSGISENNSYLDQNGKYIGPPELASQFERWYNGLTDEEKAAYCQRFGVK